MSIENRSRRCLLAALLLGLGAPAFVAATLAPAASADTPRELDAVVEAFKRLGSAGDADARLNLAYAGLDLYAPVPKKGERIDTEDRDALCEMKRVVILDALQQVDPAVVVTACGSTGRWLIEPGMIQNRYDGKKHEEIARSKHKGFYMEGLSDLDFMIMGPGARTEKKRVEEILSVGRRGAGLDDTELGLLEISFMIDPQIRTLAGEGDPHRLWRQLLRVEESTPHPEKYITKGGKALYGVDHLEERGAALVPGAEGLTTSFDAWSDSAGQTLGPFTAQYAYGGCVDMDYFMRHAMQKTGQLAVKTVMQVVKYLERQAWILERSAKNRDRLPGELDLRAKHVLPLANLAQEIRAFCTKAITDEVWAGADAFERFKKKALARSKDACQSTHHLVLGIGNALLEDLREKKLTKERAIVLAEIAYDVETVQVARYAHGMPSWYADFPVSHVKPSEKFVRDFKELQPRQYEIFAELGLLVPEDRLLAEAEIGPIKPPPIATVALERPTADAASVPAGSRVSFTVKGDVAGLLDAEPDWKKGWFTDDQVEAMREVAVWSWMASTERLQLEHLESILKTSRAAGRTGGKGSEKEGEKGTYVSHYELSDLVTRVAEREEYVADAAERLGTKPPAVHTDRMQPKTRAVPTMSAPADYLATLIEQCVLARETLESLSSGCDRAVTVARKAADAGVEPDRLRGLAATLEGLKAEAAPQLEVAGKALADVEHWGKVALAVRDAAKGDVGDLAGKVEGLTRYLEELTTETEQTVARARDLQTRLAHGIDLFRTTARSAGSEGAAGDARSALLGAADEWDDQLGSVSARELSALEERAVWLRRGSWASKSVKLALDTVTKVQEYRKAHEALAWSNLSEEMSRSLLGLKACGDVICAAADKIPITVLRQVIKDYASLLQRMPEMAIAFDTIVSTQRQRIGYDLRIRDTVPRGYLGVLDGRKDLDPNLFYRDMGPFSLAGRLHVLGHDEGTAEVDASGRSLSRKLPDLGAGQFWLVWKPTSATGFVRLDPETYQRANRYVAWYGRLYGKPIQGTLLHDLLTRGRISGSYWAEQEAIGVAQLEGRARDALRLEAFSHYLADLVGRTDFSTDELLQSYALLDRAARRLGRSGFLLRPHDARTVMAEVHVKGGDELRSWSQTLEGLLPEQAPKPGEALAGLLDASARFTDSLTSGKRQRMEQAVAELIEQKQGIREEARRRVWAEARDAAPAGLLLADVRLVVEHTLYWKGGKRRVTETLDESRLDAASKAFATTASFDVPKDAKGPGIYVCKVSIRPYGASRVTRHLLVDIAGEPEPPDPIKTKPPIRPTGDCPAPEGAILVDEPGSPDRYWYVEPGPDLPRIKVGPFTEWWTPERKTLKQELCHDENGNWTGVRKQYWSTGKLRDVTHHRGGKMHGERIVYFEDGVTVHWHENYKDDLEHGDLIYYRLDAAGKPYVESHQVWENGKRVR